MKSFILVTFGLLGFAFYEMSDGADFDPNALRVSRIDDAVLSVPAEPETQIASVQSDTPVVVPKPNEVSRSSVTLAALGTTDTTQSDTPVAAKLIPATATTDLDTSIETASKIILPSLITGLSETAAAVLPASLEAETQAIVRTVSGNRVNVRGGPGTNYDVVSRLIKGQEVEILSDPGQGWVKMRPIEGGSVGWLADFLLNES